MISDSVNVQLKAAALRHPPLIIAFISRCCHLSFKQAWSIW